MLDLIKGVLGLKSPEQTISRLPYIKNIPYDELIKKSLVYKDIQSVDLYNYVVTNGKQPIKNTGAGPCTIYYFINTQTQQVMSGHYILSNSQDYAEHANLAVKWASDFSNEQDFLNSLNNRVSQGHKNYRDMLDILHEWTYKEGKANTYAWVLGTNFDPIQNGDESINRLTSTAISRNRDISDLVEIAQLDQSHIFDTRSNEVPTVGKKFMDNSLYIPQDNSIYYSRSLHQL